MKILFISSNSIGDAILTTSVLSWLEKTYPTASFTIACGTVPSDIFRATPRLERLIPIKKQKHHKHWIDLWKLCIGTYWDIIVDLRNSAMTRLLFAKKKYYALPRNTGNHKIEDLAKAMKLEKLPNPKIWTNKITENNADQIIPKNEKIIAFGPAANWPCKQWQIEKFTKVAKKLISDGKYRGAKILVTAAPHEQDQVQPLIDAIPDSDVINLIGKDLLTVATCIKRCDLFIGNDSGLMHMAAAMNIPTIGLFGPSYDNIYAPWGEKTLVIRTPQSRDELFSKLPYKGANKPNLMKDLTAETVIEKINSFIN